MRAVDWRPSQTNLPVNFVDRPDYELLGIHVTGIPDAEYPWHYDDVIKIRRNYDPGFIPLFRRIVVRSPAGATLVYRHHGFGYCDPNREPDHRLEQCLMPTLCPWPKPNVMGFWFEPMFGKTPQEKRAGLPAPFIPWGDWIVNLCREAREESAKEAKQAYKEANENSASKRALDAAEEEARYIEREEAPIQKEAAESMTSSEFAELKARAEGWKPAHESKPFVHLASSEAK